VHRFSKGKPEPTRYFFDDASKRLTSVATPLDLPTGSAQDERFYDDYRRQSDGLWLAARTRHLRNGQLFARETISRLRTNQPFDEQKLRVPAGYRLAGPPPASKVSQLAPDIYLIDHVGGGRNVLFVNLDSSVLVMDPPLAAAVAKQVLNHVHRTLPGKPVRYVFATHFHADHSLGMPEVLKQGAALIATKPTSDKVLQLPGAVSRDARAPAQPLVAVKGKLVWGDAHHVIEFHEIPNSHVEGMAFAYFPNEKLLYQGDLLTLPEEGIMGPALPVTRELARYLKQKRMAFTRMIGHHGSNAITPDLLEQQLAR
jgi:glyoxylase-like metal-dependent hydrolase (beta-lactamase superfamily II)